MQSVGATGACPVFQIADETGRHLECLVKCKLLRLYITAKASLDICPRIILKCVDKEAHTQLCTVHYFLIVKVNFYMILKCGATNGICKI